MAQPGRAERFAGRGGQRLTEPEQRGCEERTRIVAPGDLPGALPETRDPRPVGIGRAIEGPQTVDAERARDAAGGFAGQRRAARPGNADAHPLPLRERTGAGRGVERDGGRGPDPAGLHRAERAWRARPDDREILPPDDRAPRSGDPGEGLARPGVGPPNQAAESDPGEHHAAPREPPPARQLGHPGDAGEPPCRDASGRDPPCPKVGRPPPPPRGIAARETHRRDPPRQRELHPDEGSALGEPGLQKRSRLRRRGHPAPARELREWPPKP